MTHWSQKVATTDAVARYVTRTEPVNERVGISLLAQLQRPITDGLGGKLVPRTIWVRMRPDGGWSIDNDTVNDWFLSNFTGPPEDWKFTVRKKVVPHKVCRNSNYHQPDHACMGCGYGLDKPPRIML